MHIKCFPVKVLEIKTECSETNEQVMPTYKASALIMIFLLKNIFYSNRRPQAPCHRKNIYFLTCRFHNTDRLRTQQKGRETKIVNNKFLKHTIMGFIERK